MTARILLGHVLDRLAELPADSVHMVWTSPPYWGLRCYGTEPQTWPTGWRGEHGLEPTLALWLRHEVEIFRAVRRVLRPDGTLWLNVGDAYASSTNGRPADEIEDDDRTFRDKPISTVQGSLKPKDRIGLPHRLVLALQDDGWWWRDETVWAKPNPMPSSVRDRTTPAHEFVFMLSKSPRYFYDAVAIQESAVSDHVSGNGYKRPAQLIRRNPDGTPRGSDDGWTAVGGRRQKRSVWAIAAEPYAEAHFATAPTALVRPCILAGTSARGVCPTCGAPHERVTRRIDQGWDGSKKAEAYLKGTGGALSGGTAKSTLGSAGQEETLGWRPGCGCAPAEPLPAVVLDPFGGAGTTAVVADDLGRDAILIELNPDYAAMAQARIRHRLGRVRSDIPATAGAGLPLFGVAGP